ncbi:hypothetical protein QL093DRAFT_2038500, partial [Fusarium oxysporum]
MESREINLGLLMQLLTLFLYKLNKIPYLRRLRQHLRHILFASPKLYIKATAFITLAEAKSMQFITQIISILVLKVYYSFKHKGHIYILMEGPKVKTYLTSRYNNQKSLRRKFS